MILECLVFVPAHDSLRALDDDFSAANPQKERHFLKLVKTSVKLICAISELPFASVSK